ncbi:hypothetical protein M408DRAFT_328630 [Serendipita vermifera MAFF 305830]|uniref:Uncharacterized protein n=1 Tax=Serendipita vermifera MAFF 305830 TaxID=933852 RepID=A0A0C2XLD9_SERVB|nr:hypothetical protein M408DRAFT_328630 [Serendipita vermifera MAFF 305830]
MGGPSYEKILQAAENVLDALDEIGETWCCLVGGLAVKLYGTDHRVSDLDILVLSPDTDQRGVQDALVELQPDRFLLQRPREPNVDFMKLYYRIPGTKHRIKIDLLLSTTPELEIPQALRPSHFVYSNNLPLAPLYFTLYHKLLGWDKRITAKASWRRKKAWVKDSPDILGLCDIAANQGLRPLSKSHMGREYRVNFQSRAQAFVRRYGGDAGEKFRRIGFRV